MDDSLFYTFTHRDGDCWIWHGGKQNKRYGNWKQKQAHRYSYYLHTGYMPTSKEYVCHKCDVPLCVNPEHLFLGTQKDNMMDMVAKGRQGPVKFDKNPNHKLSFLDVFEIKRLFSLGVNGMLLSKMFRISKSQIYRILNNESWST